LTPGPIIAAVVEVSSDVVERCNSATIASAAALKTFPARVLKMYLLTMNNGILLDDLRDAP
jgi:hypothetical protein